ncbi:hypothetical protein [uncultured Polaribacter sp.]|uniref:hypothetical protein n=1 Tax=uncultured Polaribacter sp. TaxID=174711 RepID=UPI002636EA37|nr:hypothetical protein [uncultured Polaribacter sp.]
MAVKIHKEDVLAHINGPETLAGQVATTNACISLLGALKVCADVQGDAVKVTVYLMGIEIGSGTLSLSHPSITIGGGAAGFKAEVKLTLKTDPIALEICGKVCAPFVGCKSGCTTLHL